MAANSENSSRPSLESFRLCVQSICPKFNVSSLKESQFQALYSFICGEEVFVNLPTGSGKSLIFQLAPLVHTWMHEHILSTGDLRHQYGIFGGESQTSLFPFRSSLRDVNERRLYSQARVFVIVISLLFLDLLLLLRHLLSNILVFSTQPHKHCNISSCINKGSFLMNTIYR